MTNLRSSLLTGLFTLLSASALAADHTHLDAFNDPYNVGLDFPKLATPQWVGEEGVDAVVILSIDDMRGYQRWEAYLRPIIDRMKKTQDGAHLSIMTCRIDPQEPHLQTWIKEGLSIDVHTIDHPCPCLQGGDFAKASGTYHDCVDLLAQIPNTSPVAFRMPCCDSQNTPSPRFFAEIFNKTSPDGRFLAIDSSVFNITTPQDASLPRELVLNEQKQPRFRRYLPFPSFVNTIEDYPYPYVIGGLCWEFPCVVPSDWEAQHVQKPGNPITVADMLKALTATVIKQGVYPLVFHPYGWIRNDQIVELIDGAEKQHGKRVKFLSFRDCAERISKNLLAGDALRASDGGDNGVRLLDLNNDGFQDVVIGNSQRQMTRIWSAESQAWTETTFPTVLISRDEKRVVDHGGRFGVLGEGQTVLLLRNERSAGAWRFDGTTWQADDTLLAGLEIDGKPVLTSRGGVDQGVRLRDLNGDGSCELIVANPSEKAVFGWDDAQRQWKRLPFNPPQQVVIVDKAGNDGGMRFVDLNGDDQTDIVTSTAQTWSAHLLTSLEKGWDRHAAGSRESENAIPPITRGATNNGSWFHSEHLWVQNEDTQRLPNGVDRISFKTILTSIENADAKSGKQSNSEMPDPLDPKAGLASIALPPGLKLELVAAEPLIVDPVAFDWGPDGRLWVVEMRDYPNGLDGQGKPGGRVKVLSDTDGDGRYDHAVLFADDLPFPTGVKVWRQGVLLTAAPKILYAADTDDDGSADVVETLYEGFGEGNQQHRVNGLRWGLDNWLYVGNGDSGGQIQSIKTKKAVNVSRRDLRIQPDLGLLEAISGNTQYGINRDDWGNWFGGNNSHPAWHYILDDVYLRRNPHLAPPAVKREISVAPGAARVYPRSETLARFNNPNSANHFTSACSPMIYRDNKLGQAYAGNLFVCEPVHNLIHREVVAADGVSFTSRRAASEQESEFLASTDNWFRPSMIRTGPDGALWFSDMYRYVIEHPKWIPPDWAARLDVRAGADRGRIYRIVPAEGPKLRTPRLDSLTPQQLVDRLESSNGPERDLTHQMLVWESAPAAVALLEQKATQGASPLARLHALSALSGMKQLKPAIALAVLGDEHSGVRRWAVRLSESLAEESSAWATALKSLAADADPQVRLQVAYSAGEWKDQSTGAAVLATMLLKESEPNIRAAAMSSLNAKNLPLVLSHSPAQPTAQQQQRWGEVLRQVAAWDDPQTLATSVAQLVKKPASGFAMWQLQTAASLLSTAKKKEAVALAQKELAPLFSYAKAALQKPDTPLEMQIASLELLAQGPAADRPSVASLRERLRPVYPPQMQSVALDLLAATAGADDRRSILQGWRGYSPSLRTQLLDRLMQQEADTLLLLEALEKGVTPPSQLDATRRRALLEHRSKAVQAAAKKLFASATQTTRAAVIEKYRPALQLTGHAAAGKAVFAKRCAACHRLESQGHVLGPDLAALSNPTGEVLLTAILDPNRAVEDKFLAFTAVTNAGRIHTGMLTSEAGASLTLTAPDGKAVQLLRKDLDEFYASGKSFMPEGLEQDLTPQNLADVIAYIRSVGAKPKSFPGNKPELVRVDDQGVLHLRARSAKIFGPRIVFETKYGNLGFWSSPQDQAVWTVEAPAAGRYKIEIEYACPQSMAGDTLQISAGQQTAQAKIASTKTWDEYVWKEAGEVTLTQGPAEIVARSAGEIRGALMDLREIRLTPVK